MDELLSEFVAETKESLAALANVAVALEADPSDRNLLDELFRFFHTVKGSCGFLNLPRFEKLSHAAEDVLSDIRAGDGTPDSPTISAVLAVMDRIADLCAAVESGDALPHENDDELIQALRRCYDGAEEDVASPDIPAPVQTVESQSRSSQASRTIRLPLALIDQLMNGVSDMVLARNEVARKLRGSSLDPELESVFDRLSGCIADMRDTISKTRMQRVDRLFMAIPRVVRDVSRDLGKSVELMIDGGDVEMDREMVEMVVDPLTHIVRNSLDHGIETPEERRKAGKRETGDLRISARQSGSQIVIEVADDGRGINVEAVAAKVVSAGIMTAQEVAQLSERAKLDLIFTPGLSTAREVTSVSGRGVGMDVVRANIERIGGVVSLTSEPGKGLVVTMRVPLTLTIIPGLILSAGGLNFAIPRSAVIEILHDNNPTVSVAELGGGITATIRNMRYSMIDLEDVIGVPRVERAGPRSLMIVRSAVGRPFILGVGHVENHEELVIRPAAPVVMASGIYAGMTLPDNGQPMLLLDAGGIAQAAQLPLISEMVDQGKGEDAAEEARTDTYTGLRFIELTGEERIIRLSLVERVEDVPVGCFGESAGRAHVRLGGRLLPCVGHVDIGMIPTDQREVTCMRVRDDRRELCYPVASVIDIDEVPVALGLAMPNGAAVGLVLIGDRQVEVVDSLAVLAAGGDRNDPVPVARCVIADDQDTWNREILAPLLAQAGYDVVWGADANTSGPDDIVLLTSGDEEVYEKKGAAIIRLRPDAAPSGPADMSICRYDGDALLQMISELGKRRATA